MKISPETTIAKVILAPSRIQGVGLFAIKNLAKGEEVPIWDQNDLRFFEVPSADDRLFYGIFHHYCIRTKGGYYGPKDFLKMSIGWYINHSDAPNLEERLEETTWRYYATRAIAKEEEVTMDYRTLDADYDNLPVRNTSHVHVDSDLEEVKQDTKMLLGKTENFGPNGSNWPTGPIMTIAQIISKAIVKYLTISGGKSAAF
jgi:SET domain-containing protein